MAFWSWRKAKSVELLAIPGMEWVEEVVARLKASPPMNSLCFTMLKAGSPDTWLPIYSKASGEDDVRCYTQHQTAKILVDKGIAEEVLAVGNAAELWAFLNNPRRGTSALYTPP